MALAACAIGLAVSQYGAGRAWFQRTVADFTGDGRTDYALVRNTGGGSGGATTWFNKTTLTLPRRAPIDFDADTRTDYMVVRNTGGGAGGAITWFGGTSRRRRFTPVDVTGDSRTDYVVVRNTGGGAGGAITWFGATGSDVRRRAVIDFTGSGRTDFALVRSYGGPVGWTFSPPHTGFIDEEVAAGHVIRKIHVTELRLRIDALRLREGLAPYAWTDPELTVGASSVRAVHVSEMRTALAAVYTALARTAPTYTTPALGASVVQAIHIRELRAAVVAVER